MVNFQKTISTLTDLPDTSQVIVIYDLINYVYNQKECNYIYDSVKIISIESEYIIELDLHSEFTTRFKLLELTQNNIVVDLSIIQIKNEIKIEYVQSPSKILTVTEIFNFINKHDAVREFKLNQFFENE